MKKKEFTLRVHLKNLKKSQFLAITTFFFSSFREFFTTLTTLYSQRGRSPNNVEALSKVSLNSSDTLFPTVTIRHLVESLQ